MVGPGVAVVGVGLAVVGVVVAVGGLLCGVLCGLFCPYPVSAKQGASSKLLATANSAGISLLRSILLITEPLSRNRRHTTRIFPYAAPTMFACAAFSKESRMNCANATRFHGKSGTRYSY